MDLSDVGMQEVNEAPPPYRSGGTRAQAPDLQDRLCLRKTCLLGGVCFPVGKVLD